MSLAVYRQWQITNEADDDDALDVGRVVAVGRPDESHETVATHQFPDRRARPAAKHATEESCAVPKSDTSPERLICKRMPTRDWEMPGLSLCTDVCLVLDCNSNQPGSSACV